MDKRSLVFVFALSIAFICVQFFFRYQDTQHKQEWTAQQERVMQRKNKELEADLTHRVAPLNTLPIVEAFKDAKGDSFFTHGIQLKGSNSVLVQLSKEEAPATLYVRPQDSSQVLIPLPLARQTADGGGIAIYSKDPQAVLEVASHSDLIKGDLQLISSAVPASQNNVEVALATFHESKLNFPGSRIKRFVPQGDALALVKTFDGYLPVASYSHASSSLRALDQFSELQPIATPHQGSATTPRVSKQPRFYVLEDAYQQLVFSDVGGALVEINLPYSTNKDHLSVVKEVGIDRDVEEQDPSNARFPLHPYFIATLEGKNAQITEHLEGKLGGYYPLLRRDLMTAQGKMLSRVPPRYYALNLVSEYPEMAEVVYEVVEFDAEHIVFRAEHLDKKITKTFRLPKSIDGAPYCIDLEVAIEGPPQALWLTSGVPEVEIISGTDAPTLKYRITRGTSSKVELIDLPKEDSTVASFHPDWVCDSNGFFGIIMDPQTEMSPGYEAIRVPPKEVPSRLLALDPKGERWNAASFAGYELLMPLKKKAGVQRFRIFAGPFAESVLQAVDTTYGDPTTGETPDYIAAQTFHGWFAFISEPFARFLFLLMKGFYWLTGSWGFSIILLTVALKVILYPFNAWSAKSLAAMQAIGPEIAAIDEKYKNNPNAAQMEKIALYRERKVNPLSGCLPMLLQIPFLIGMFDLLKSTFALRGAVFIPGWIDDLAAPDVLFSWKQPVIPFIGNELHFLPILLGLVMLAQQHFTAPVSSPMTDQQRQQRVMGNIMAVVFAAMFYQFPSGLNIYWLSSMLLGIAQQWYTNRHYKKPVSKAKGKKGETIEVQGKRVS